MSPRPDVSEERRNQILAAAIQVFARLGFNKARMDDIVKEAGLSKGALYWYFKSKDEIVMELLSRYFDPAFEELEALIASPEPASLRLHSLTQQLATKIATLPNVLPLAYEFYAAATHRDNIREPLGQYFAQYRSRLAELIRQGNAAGEFRAVDPEVTATALEAMYEGMALFWLLDPHQDWGEMAAMSLQVLLKGIEIKS